MVGNGYLQTIRRNIPVPEDLDRPPGASQFGTLASYSIQIVVGARFPWYRGPQHAPLTGAQRATKLVQRAANGNLLRGASFDWHTHQFGSPRSVIPWLFAFTRARVVQNKVTVRRQLRQHLCQWGGDNDVWRSLVDSLLEEVIITPAIGLEDHGAAVRCPRMGIVCLVVQGQAANIADAWRRLIKVANENAV